MQDNRFWRAKKEGSALILAIALTAVSGIVVMNIGQIAVSVTRSAAEEGVQKGKDLFRARELMEIASYEIKQLASIPETWQSVSDFQSASDVVTGYTNTELMETCMRVFGDWNGSTLQPDAAGERQLNRRYSLGSIRVLPMQGVGAVLAGRMTDVSNSLAANDLEVTSVIACAAPNGSSLRRVQANLINFRGVMRTVEIREI